MALLRYFKLAGGLPHPKCSLSSAIDPDIIAEMNKEVEEASHSEAKQGHTVPTAHQSVYRLASTLLCRGQKQHLDFFQAN